MNDTTHGEPNLSFTESTDLAYRFMDEVLGVRQRCADRGQRVPNGGEMCGDDSSLELAVSKPKSLCEAEVLVERCMADLGIRYPETLSAIIALSEEYKASGKLDSAQYILENAIRDYGPWDGEHDYPIERVVLQLSAVLTKQGLNRAAKAIQEEVLNAWRYDFGRGDRETILAMNLLVETLTELGEFTPALSLGLEALEATQTLTGVESDESAMQLSSIALVHRKMSDSQSRLRR